MERHENSQSATHLCGIYRVLKCVITSGSDSKYLKKSFYKYVFESVSLSVCWAFCAFSENEGKF